MNLTMPTRLGRGEKGGSGGRFGRLVGGRRWMWRRREEKKEKLVVVEVVMGQTKSPSKRQPPSLLPSPSPHLSPQIFTDYVDYVPT